MDTINLMPILITVITLIGAIITSIAIPYIKATASTERLGQLATWVNVFVGAAEQIYGAGKGKDKLQYVADMLKSKGYTIDVDDTTDAVRAMIEAAVLELNTY